MFPVCLLFIAEIVTIIIQTQTTKLWDAQKIQIIRYTKYAQRVTWNLRAKNEPKKRIAASGVRAILQ